MRYLQPTSWDHVERDAHPLLRTKSKEKSNAGWREGNSKAGLSLGKWEAVRSDPTARSQGLVLPSYHKEHTADSQVRKEDVHPNVRRQRAEERKDAGVGPVGFPVENADPQSHEGLGEVNRFFPDVRDGQRRNGQIRFLWGRCDRREGRREKERERKQLLEMAGGKGTDNGRAFLGSLKGSCSFPGDFFENLTPLAEIMSGGQKPCFKSQVLPMKCCNQRLKHRKEI